MTERELHKILKAALKAALTEAVRELNQEGGK